jgi:putative transposase
MPSYRFPRRDLPRLGAESYRDFAWVHWTMTLENRAAGWLTAKFHAEFRLLLLHTCARYSLVCPVYCLMPDHMHLLFMGIAAGSDQRIGLRFLRRHLNTRLGSDRLQRQAYDHVLRATERGPRDFENAAAYIRENPVRAGLVSNWTEWQFGGCMVFGYPELDPLYPDFWTRFWRIHDALRTTASDPRTMNLRNGET